jgi:hypothetical protein
MDCLPCSNTNGQIDRQYSGCCSTDIGKPDQHPLVVLKMLAPTIASWIEQSRQTSSFRIETRNVWAFELIASTAAKRKIIQFCLTTVLPSNDVIQNMLEANHRFGHSAVFAFVLCQSPDGLLDRFAHLLKLPACCSMMFWPLPEESQGHRLPSANRLIPDAPDR